ncbi:isochorismatase family protein [Deefgea tanakiae]|uniref:Isochorismatase family protein n=1 Tax=Deefgea tanakiae TaxID=2865840 RepID=A0ABX8ZB99_9NEIS|nr:isochorismatase family protein [Deefgea tanakiae]QZA78599.1 isochorismatase family protein [Deefgea tanakiae]
MSHSQSALLVIDVQQSFLHRPYFSELDLPEFQTQLLKLIAACQAQAIPVITVLHVEPEGAFAKASNWVKPMDFLPPLTGLVFEKTVHNALIGSGLHEWLQQQGITHLIISGIRTEQCCETTTRVASDLGYVVEFVTEATLTFAMQHPNGNIYSAAEIKERTELVLHERFARICTVDDIVQRFAAQAVAA